MADESYDVVIVGAGSKSLVAAMYLTKYGGLSVGMFEERNEIGSGWSSEEPAGGWAGNTCSNDHIYWYQTALYWDFPEFKDYGARYALTPTTVGTTFEDGTCFLQFSAFPEVDPDQERTAKLIDRFSKRDGDTYRWLWDKPQTTGFPVSWSGCLTRPSPSVNKIPWTGFSWTLNRVLIPTGS
ncbi:MAG: NAD(P)-binding protein [Thermodesulfobacteriota bacterium]|nr:NAD(P)-binding protein [Thermodesulfobacteriota bacterium]